MPRLLVSGLLIYTGFFLGFYPPICGIEDEQGFVNQAIFWSRGGVSAEGAGLSPHLGDLMMVQGVHVPMRHPGRSLTVLPFYLAGRYRAIFLSGLILHISMTVLAAAVLGRMGISKNYALLVLFHPTLLIYSRTITADAAAGLGLLLSIYGLAGRDALKRGDVILAGLGVSLAATMRHHAVAALPAVLWAVWCRGGGWRPVVQAATASALGALPLMLFNLRVYGSLMDPFSAGRGAFALEYLKEQVPFYLMALSIFWPLMFFAPIQVAGPLQSISRGICLTFLMLLGCYYFHDTGANLVQSSVLGLRLMQVALPAWIMAYISVLAKMETKIMETRIHAWRKSLIFAFFAICALMTTFLFQGHSRRLEDYAGRRLALLRAVPENAVLLNEGMMPKLLGIYRADQPDYEFYAVTFASQRSYADNDIQDREARGLPIYMVYSSKQSGDGPSEIFRDLIKRMDAKEIPTKHPQVRVWKPMGRLK